MPKIHKSTHPETESHVLGEAFIHYHIPTDTVKSYAKDAEIQGLPPKLTKSTTQPTATKPRKKRQKRHEIAAIHLTDGGALASACLKHGDGGEDEGERLEAAEHHDDWERDRTLVPSPSPSPAAPGGPMRR